VDPEIVVCALALVFVTVGRVMWTGSLLEGDNIGGIEPWERDAVMWDALVAASADGPVLRDELRSELLDST